MILPAVGLFAGSFLIIVPRQNLVSAEVAIRPKITVSRSAHMKAPLPDGEGQKLGFKVWMEGGRGAYREARLSFIS